MTTRKSTPEPRSVKKKKKKKARLTATKRGKVFALWKPTQSRFDPKNHDIIGSMLLDLQLEVVQYLDPADVARSQRVRIVYLTMFNVCFNRLRPSQVSRKWRSIFSSDAVTKLVLRQTLASLNMEGTDVSAADKMNYFRWHMACSVVSPRKFFTTRGDCSIPEVNMMPRLKCWTSRLERR